MKTRGHDPALALLHKLAPKAVLTPEAKQRIAAEVFGARAARPRKLWTIGFTLALSAGALGLWLAIRERGHEPTPPPSPIVRSMVSVPACSIVRSNDEGESALIGPATAQVDRSKHGIQLDDGRLLLRTTNQIREVVTPSGKITLARYSFAEFVVRDRRPIRVAVFVGSAAIEGPVPIQVTEGTCWESGSIRPLDAATAAEAKATLEGQSTLDSSCAPVEQVSEAAPQPPPPQPPSPRRPHVVPAQPAHPAQETAEAPAVDANPPEASPETAALGEAIRLLRQKNDPRAALTVLDRLAPAAHGEFARDVALVRVEALLRLGETQRALQLLDQLPPEMMPRSTELLILRAELRAGANRCREALVDYGQLLDMNAPAVIVERALYGRAACRMRIGDEVRGREDLADYLRRFPSGHFAAEARQSLGH